MAQGHLRYPDIFWNVYFGTARAGQGINVVFIDKVLLKAFVGFNLAADLVFEVEHGLCMSNHVLKRGFKKAKTPFSLDGGFGLSSAVIFAITVTATVGLEGKIAAISAGAPVDGIMDISVLFIVVALLRVLQRQRRCGFNLLLSTKAVGQKGFQKLLHQRVVQCGHGICYCHG